MSDKSISNMNIKELRNEVQSLRDELAIMQRKYEDILYNLDTDNFSSRFTKEQGDMRTAIEVTAKGIKTKVSKEELKEYSTIEQTAQHIQNIVSKGAMLDTAKEIDSLADATDTSKIYVIRETDDDDNVLSETYYYFNDITKKWEVLSGDNIYTVFEQTPEGFKLRGNVKIDGSLILTDTLTFNSTDRPLDVQYSADGTANSWHYEFDSSNDKFMRIKIGSQWSEAMKVVGDKGETGPTGPTGGTANVTFAKVNSVLGYLFKTVDGGTPTTVTDSYIFAPSVLGGEFYGGRYYAGIGKGYSSMDEEGFTVNDNDGLTKIALGYDSDEYTYPYVILGAGTGYASNGAAVVYKMGNGIWIGDSSVMKYPGDCPGGFDENGNINAILQHATGLFIDFVEDEVYIYRSGWCEALGTGGSGTNYAEFK